MAAAGGDGGGSNRNIFIYDSINIKRRQINFSYVVVGWNRNQHIYKDVCAAAGLDLFFGRSQPYIHSISHILFIYNVYE